MKIISNYKDYYDHILAVRGIDEKALYVRNCNYKPNHLGFPNTLYHHYSIALCGIIYVIYYYDGKFYFGEDYKQIPNNEHTAPLHRYMKRDSYVSKLHLTKTNINDIENCPVILLKLESNGDYTIIVKNPRLRDYGIPSLLSPDDCFVKSTNFLLKEKEISDPRTNKEKRVGHGFDYKTSFRNM